MTYLIAAAVFVVALAAVVELAAAVAAGLPLSQFVTDSVKWIAVTWLEAELSTLSFYSVIRTSEAQQALASLMWALLIQQVELLNPMRLMMIGKA